jgi:hypothetical protein
VVLQQLLLDQAGIATRQQLGDCGLTPDMIKAQIRGRRWRSLNESAIACHNGPLTIEQARWAVVLSTTSLVALSSVTGLEVVGVKGFETTEIHVLVPHGGRVLPVPGVTVVVHESRRFTAQDVLPRLPPVTSLERSAVDAAVWSVDARAAARVIVAVIQQRRTTAVHLRETLIDAGQVRYRPVLMRLLNDLDGGAEALSEVAFLRWCRRNGFPKPTLQVRQDSDGRRRYIDAGFVRADGRQVLVEIDGGVHLSLATRWQDTAKDNDAFIAGRLTLRFPSIAIYSNDPVAVRQLRGALGIGQQQRAS